MNVLIEPSWKRVLETEFEKDYFKKLTDFVKKEYDETTVYPPPKFIFRAFWETPFDKVKVVILGQDPYHGEGEANGLCFAVNDNVKLPPSLQNIYKELKSDLNVDGNIKRWAGQGVLLLNSTLTVRADSPGSHQKRGWEEFTDTVIRILSQHKERLVFILWGKYAQNKALQQTQGKVIIDETKHLILKSPHPSPFAANNGFFGSRPFSKCNQYLKDQGKTEIDW